MDVSNKISILENNLKRLPVTDYDFHNVAETFVNRNGWKESMDFDTAFKDCLCYMAVKLKNKH